MHCSKEFFLKKIREIDFKQKNFQSYRRLLVRKLETTAWRGRYLQALKKFQSAGMQIIYLDETYPHPTCTVVS
jgi:hypothetical protein